MSVLIYNPSPSAGGTRGVGIPSGTQLPNSFTDNFTRANANNWGVHWGMFNTFCGNVGTNQVAAINGNRGQIIQSGVGSMQCVLWPLQLSWMTQGVFAHFSEITCSAVPATAAQLAPACVMSLNFSFIGGGYYGIQWVSNTGALAILRYVYSASTGTGPTQTSLSALGGATATTGDVLRLTAQPQGGGTWLLTAFKNGVSLGSATDTILAQGMPGIFCGENATGSTYSLTEYAGGKV